MTITANMQFLLLDDDWRPLHRVDGNEDWRCIVRELLLRDSHWLTIEQQRPDQRSPYPCWSDIRLSRTVARRFRPMEVKLADHIIRGTADQFSFRAAGLL